MKLRPTSYNFRGDGEYKGLKLSRGLHYGLIAQEVEEVLPSLVKDNKHTYLESAEGAGPNNPEEKTEVKSMDYKSMNYTELIPVLIKAVQEQQVEIEKLRKQIESLKKDK
jgi:flagellar biosynthesis chaperone FliJ